MKLITNIGAQPRLIKAAAFNASRSLLQNGTHAGFCNLAGLDTQGKFGSPERKQR